MVKAHLMFLKARGSHRRALKEKEIQFYGDVEGLLTLRTAPESVRIRGQVYIVWRTLRPGKRRRE